LSKGYITKLKTRALGLLEEVKDGVHEGWANILEAIKEGDSRSRRFRNLKVN